MSHDLALRAARLSTETIKTKNSKNLSIAFEHHPKDPAERKHGVLFAVIGVGGDVKRAEDLIDLILETFHGEYYQDLDKSPLASFEDALSKINDELADYTNSGHTYWMGKLNAILAVQSGNTLHLTQAGNAEAFLIRNGKEIQVSKELGGEDINPLRTFINVASGETAEADKVALVTPGILAACSSSELASYVSEHHPKVAVSHIAEVVDNLGNKEAQNSAVIVEYLSPEALANETLEEEPDEIWLESGSKKDLVLDQTKNIAKGLSGILATTAEKGKSVFKDTISPLAEKTKGKIEDFSKPDIVEEEDERDVLLETEEKGLHDFDDEGKVHFEDTQIEEITPKQDSPSKNVIRIKESEESPKLAKIEETKNAILNNIGNFYGSALKLNPIKRSRKVNLRQFQKVNKTYLAAGVFVLIAVLAFLTWIVSSQRVADKTRQSEKQILDGATEMVSEATLYQEQKNIAKSISTLNEALTSLEAIKNGKYFGAETKELQGQIQNKIFTITKSQRKQSAIYSDLTSVIKDKDTLAGIYMGDLNAYAFTVNGKVFQIDKTTGKATAVQSIGQIEGKVIAVAPLYRIKSAAILTDAPMVYEFDFTDSTYSKRTATDEWAAGSDLRSYGTNLYVLDSKQKDINKHIRTLSGYGKGLSYFPNESQVTSPVSFAIDSDVYVLDTDGAINRFTGGEPQEFKIKNLFFSLKGSDTIYTDEDTNNIFVLKKSEQSVSIFDKSGNYKKRYFLDLENPTDIYSEGNTLFILDGKKIKKITL